MSSSTIAARFFASFRFQAPLFTLALCFGGCTCQRQEAPGEHSASTEREPAAPEPAEPEPTHEAPASPPGAFPIVSAEKLLATLRASGKKATLVNAWASFCGPCKREIPMLESLAVNLGPRGIDIVLVSVDDPADMEKAITFLGDRGTAFQSYLAQPPLGAFKRGLNPRWAGMVPASFLFDSEGRLRYFWGGEAFESELLPVLEAFLAGKPIEGSADFAVVPGNAE